MTPINKYYANHFSRLNNFKKQDCVEIVSGTGLGINVLIGVYYVFSHPCRGEVRECHAP